MPTYTIGRSEECDIVVRDHSVSRHHADLRAEKSGHYVLTDLDSTNGTYVREGDEWVQIGEAEITGDERVMIGGVETTAGALFRKIDTDSSLVLEQPADAAPDGATNPPDAPSPEAQPATEPPPADPAPAAAPPGGDPAAAPAPAEPRSDARSYQDYLREKEATEGDGAAPAAKPKGGGTAWWKWASAAVAILLLIGAGTFAAIKFGPEVFGGAKSGAQKTKGKTAKAKKPAKKAGPPKGTPRKHWQVTLGGPQNDHVTTLALGADDGFLIAGYTDSAGKGATDGWAVMLDKHGWKVWERTYGGAKEDRIERILRTVDGGYIAVGRTRSKGKGDWDFWVLRLDNNGTLLWEETLGGEKSDIARGVVAVRDGGFVIAGETLSKGNAARGWLVKLDENGRKSWETTIGPGKGAGAIRINAIEQTAEGGFILVGTHTRTKRGSDLWAARLSKTRKVLWRYSVGGRRVDAGHAVYPTPKGGFIIAGSTASRGYGKGDAFLIRLSKKGKREWARVYGGKRADAALAVARIPRAGFVLVGYTESKGSVLRDLWIAQVSVSGRMQWQKKRGGEGGQAGVAVLALKAGGYVVAGNTFPGAQGKNDAWVLKLNREGGLKELPPKTKASTGEKPKATARKPATKKKKKKGR